MTGDDRAIFTGEGTINGLLVPQGRLYKFKIWASDGEPDTFRIRISREIMDGTEHDVYDNGIYDSEIDLPIGGGTIMSHKGKGK